MKVMYRGTAAAEAFPALFCNGDACKWAYKAGDRSLCGHSQAVINPLLLTSFPSDTGMRFLQVEPDWPACSKTVDRLRKPGFIDKNTRLFVHHFTHNCGSTHDELVPLAAAHGREVSDDNCTLTF